MKCLGVLVDDSFPDHLELVRQLAECCPVLAMTADGTFQSRVDFAGAGAEAVLFHPVDPMDVLDWCRERVAKLDASAASVLIIEDDRLTAEIYAAALGCAGLDVAIAESPEQALGLVTAGYPDLILLDIRMPEITGIKLAKVIRQSKGLLGLPIVFVSAERDFGQQLLARRLGGDDFIKKPVDLNQLVSLVKMRTERSREMRAMMERDGLTGLYNQGAFKDRLARAFERCRRTEEHFSLALIDIDRFKAINDAFGHLCGDTVIRSLAATLTSGLRRTDICGRYGGEEFAIILPDTPIEAAITVANRLRERFLGTSFDFGDGLACVTFSGGVASNRDSADVTTLIRSVDAALYAAKDGGRNRIERSKRR